MKNIEKFFTKLMVLTKDDNYRDLVDSIHAFSENTNWTYCEHISGDHRKFFRAFVISKFVDIEEPIWTIKQAQKLCSDYDEKLSEEEIMEMQFWFKELGIL